MVRYVVLGMLMLAFLRMSGDGDGSAVLLSSFIGVWAFGVALYDLAVSPSPLIRFRKQNSAPANPERNGISGGNPTKSGAGELL